jgi:hypothetical protein
VGRPLHGVGVVLGLSAPGLMQGLRSLEFGAGSQINVPTAILIWLMITPMMMKVDFAVMLSVGSMCNRTRHWFPAPAGAHCSEEAMTFVTVFHHVPRPIIGMIGTLCDPEFQKFEADLDWLEHAFPHYYSVVAKADTQGDVALKGE